MPTRAKAAGRLAGLVGSDSEPDFETIDSRHTGSATSRAMPAIKRGRGRPPASAANKITKPAQKATRGNGKATVSSRQALSAKSNTNVPRATKARHEDVDDGDEMDATGIDDPSAAPEEEVVKAPRGRPSGGHSATKKPAVGARRGRPPSKKAAQPLVEVPEIEGADAMDVDDDDREEPSVDDTDALPTSTARDFEESVIDRDASDVSLRRRLGELTRKYENLEARHRDLREVGVKEAERNYERLRKQNEESTNSSNKLISQLKTEIAAQTNLAKEGDELRQQLERSEGKVESLQDKVADLNRSLIEARSEVKTLSNKLAAARSAEANVKVPGSALKTGAANGRAPPSEVVQAAQAKEDLYGDLTGLIVRGLKRGTHEDVFDCIQTGRNGTLHFKLSVDSIEEASSYEDVQFTYRPQLDEDRDGDLMDLLPDYLIEEITFQRPQASKFYSRVIKSLTERLD